MLDYDELPKVLQKNLKSYPTGVVLQEWVKVAKHEDLYFVYIWVRGYKYGKWGADLKNNFSRWIPCYFVHQDFEMHYKALRKVYRAKEPLYLLES